MRAKKSLGQNFIHDENFLKNLDRSIKSGPKTNIIEIGPGKGALTKYLIKKKHKKIYLIEKDKILADYLRKDNKNNPKIIIENVDALNFNLLNLNLKSDTIIVGNLPFNISSQLLIKWMKLNDWPPFYQNMYLMFQKELGERIIANENSKVYGRISVLAQSRFKIEKLFIAPSGIFFPKPKVNGIVLKFTPIEKYKNIDLSKLEIVLRKAFQQRRKKIKTSLKEYSDILLLNKFDLNSRAENIKVSDYCKISNLIIKK